MTEKLVAAFLEVNEGFFTDRVLADSELNKRFIAACKSRGLTDSPEHLNRKLINLRKSGKLGKLNSIRTLFNDEEYRFAAEIAVRHFERRDQITLDDILVSPSLASEFDEISQGIAPGYSSLRYRWSALSLRKSRSLTPEIFSQAVPSKEVYLHKVDSVQIDDIPKSPGIYCFVSEKASLYVGEASCLRTRLKKHLEHSDNKYLARWMWEYGTGELTLELHILDEQVKTKVRKALETELIRSRKPQFNVLGKLA